MKRQPLHSVDEGVLFPESRLIAFYRKNKGLAYGGLAAAVLFSLVLFFQFSNQKPQLLTGNSQPSVFGLVVNVEGSVFVERGLKKNRLVRGDRLSPGDWVQTTPNATIDIAFSPFTAMRLQAQGRVLLKNLLRDSEGNQVLLFLEQGTLVNQIQKLGARDSYTVETSYLKTMVRGTAFLIQTDGEESSIVLDTGRVEVVNLKGTWFQTLEEHQALLVEQQSLQPWTLRKNQPFAAKKDLEEMKIFLSSIEASAFAYSNSPSGLSSALKKENRGFLEEIRLKNGSILRGTILSQAGLRLTLQTEAGNVVINSEDVSEIRMLQE